MNGAHASHTVRRQQLVERCQKERQDLLAMTVTAIALAPRLRALARVARSFHRILRILHVHASSNRAPDVRRR